MVMGNRFLSFGKKGVAYSIQFVGARIYLQLWLVPLVQWKMFRECKAQSFLVKHEYFYSNLQTHCAASSPRQLWRQNSHGDFINHVTRETGR